MTTVVDMTTDLPPLAHGRDHHRVWVASENGRRIVRADQITNVRITDNSTPKDRSFRSPHQAATTWTVLVDLPGVSGSDKSFGPDHLIISRCGSDQTAQHIALQLLITISDLVPDQSTIVRAHDGDIEHANLIDYARGSSAGKPTSNQ